MALSRRETLAAAAAVLVGLPHAGRAEEQTLSELAAASGLLFGCAVSSDHLSNDASFAALVSRETSILVAEWEMKRAAVQRLEGVWDFSGGDAIAAFAARNGQKLRGHALVWHYEGPDWLKQRLAEAPDERLLTDMITRSCLHYRGRIHSWDVVNEVVDPAEGQADGLRVNSHWYRAFGEGYLETAFYAARASDPGALLFYGEYGVEMDHPDHEKKRVAVLKVIEKLKKQAAPIDGFGVQGHLDPFRARFDERIYARFLSDLQGFGLKLMVTEFDVADRFGPADVVKRDAEIAAVARRFAEVSLANPAMIGFLSWGLTDRYSWLADYPDYKWPDGQRPRGLPYDADLRPKPMRAALAAAFSERR